MLWLKYSKQCEISNKNSTMQCSSKSESTTVDNAKKKQWVDVVESFPFVLNLDKPQNFI